MFHSEVIVGLVWTVRSQTDRGILLSQHRNSAHLSDCRYSWREEGRDGKG